MVHWVCCHAESIWCKYYDDDSTQNDRNIHVYQEVKSMWTYYRKYCNVKQGGFHFNIGLMMQIEYKQRVSGGFLSL